MSVMWQAWVCLSVINVKNGQTVGPEPGCCALWVIEGKC